MIEKYLLLLHTLHPPPFHSRPSSTQTHSQVLRHFTDSGLYTDLFVITLVIKQIGLPLHHPTRVQTEFESTQSHTIKIKMLHIECDVTSKIMQHFNIA